MKYILPRFFNLQKIRPALYNMLFSPKSTSHLQRGPFVSSGQCVCVSLMLSSTWCVRLWQKHFSFFKVMASHYIHNINNVNWLDKFYLLIVAVGILTTYSICLMLAKLLQVYLFSLFLRAEPESGRWECTWKVSESHAKAELSHSPGVTMPALSVEPMHGHLYNILRLVSNCFGCI